MFEIKNMFALLYRAHESVTTSLHYDPVIAPVDGAGEPTGLRDGAGLCPDPTPFYFSLPPAPGSAAPGTAVLAATTTNSGSEQLGGGVHRRAEVCFGFSGTPVASFSVGKLTFPA
jgi:hypothetical protein